jgi:hypothetical protein
MAKRWSRRKTKNLVELAEEHGDFQAARPRLRRGPGPADILPVSEENHFQRTSTTPTTTYNRKLEFVLHKSLN